MTFQSWWKPCRTFCFLFFFFTFSKFLHRYICPSYLSGTNQLDGNAIQAFPKFSFPIVSCYISWLLFFDSVCNINISFVEIWKKKYFSSTGTFIAFNILVGYFAYTIPQTHKSSKFPEENTSKILRPFSYSSSRVWHLGSLLILIATFYNTAWRQITN